MYFANGHASEIYILSVSSIHRTVKPFKNLPRLLVKLFRYGSFFTTLVETQYFMFTILVYEWRILYIISLSSVQKCVLKRIKIKS